MRTYIFQWHCCDYHFKVVYYAKTYMQNRISKHLRPNRMSNNNGWSYSAYCKTPLKNTPFRFKWIIASSIVMSANDNPLELSFLFFNTWSAAQALMQQPKIFTSNFLPKVRQPIRQTLALGLKSLLFILWLEFDLSCWPMKQLFVPHDSTSISLKLLPWAQLCLVNWTTQKLKRYQILKSLWNLWNMMHLDLSQ